MYIAFLFFCFFPSFDVFITFNSHEYIKTLRTEGNFICPITNEAVKYGKLVGKPLELETYRHMSKEIEGLDTSYKYN